MRTIIRALAVALAVGNAFGGAPAQAEDKPAQSLSSADQVVAWHGQDANATGQGVGAPTEQTCTTDSCDTLMLKVDLPPGTFPKGPRSPAPDGVTRAYAEGPTDMPGDGVLVTVKWATDFDQWNLFVDDMSTGAPVAQGLNLDSNAQSLLLSQPHNGVYRIRVVPFLTNWEKQDARYDATAQVFHDPTQRVAPGTALLPRLQTVAPSNFHIADIPPIPSNPSGWRWTPDGTFSNSCYTDETQQFGSTRCLRFDNDIRNVGDGPLVLKFTWTPDAFTGHCEMQQVVLFGGANVGQRPAGPCIFHQQHGHFHYQNMGRYQLYPVDLRGLPGATPVAASNKVGFCTIDVDDFAFGGPAEAQRPRTYSAPMCNMPNSYSAPPPLTSPYGPGGVSEFMGISPGWGDIYTWDLPAQYIDISHGVPDGVYEVVSRSNFDGGILSANRDQETGITCIRITGNTVSVLDALPSQSNSAPLPPCDGRALAAKRRRPAATERHRARRSHRKRRSAHARHHRTRRGSSRPR
jgi:hypothetical protein